MKKVWEVCDVSDDIKFGSLDESKFAIELYSVLEGKADETYTNSDFFFEKTFLTNNMKHIIIQILKRLSTGSGLANLILSNEFGGGKTHTLLLIYHILKNTGGKGFEYIRRYDIDKELGIASLPTIDVVSIDCRTLGNEITLWGKIAKEVEMYDKIKKYDKQQNPPPVTILTEILERPTLILIDELYSYLKNAKGIVVGKSDLSELTLNFLINLMSAISTTKRSQLLLTTTGEQHLYQEEAKDFSIKIDLMDKLRESISRFPHAI
jgi:predicted AAA+ superfamily ATPase